MFNSSNFHKVWLPVVAICNSIFVASLLRIAVGEAAAYPWMSFSLSLASWIFFIWGVALIYLYWSFFASRADHNQRDQADLPHESLFRLTWIFSFFLTSFNCFPVFRFWYSLNVRPTLGHDLHDYSVAMKNNLWWRRIAFFEVILMGLISSIIALKAATLHTYVFLLFFFGLAIAYFSLAAAVRTGYYFLGLEDEDAPINQPNQRIRDGFHFD